MARFLITGGAGFLGSHLAAALLKKGHSVRILDDLSSGFRGNVSPTAEFVNGDITTVPSVARALEGIDCCYHLAAIASVERANRELLRTHQVNVSGTVNVFEQAQRLRRPVPVIYASSAAVYGHEDNRKVDEDHGTAPLNSYGVDKVACEMYARVAGEVHGVPTVGLRFFNIYGPGQDPRSPYSGVVSIFVDRLIRGQPIEIFGDGGQVRDFIYVDDAVTALCNAASAAATRAPVFNVCTGIGTSVLHLADAIAALCGTRPKITWALPRPGDVGVSIGDPARGAAGFGFRARVSLADGLASTIGAVKSDEHKLSQPPRLPPATLPTGLPVSR